MSHYGSMSIQLQLNVDFSQHETLILKTFDNSKFSNIFIYCQAHAADSTSQASPKKPEAHPKICKSSLLKGMIRVACWHAGLLAGVLLAPVIIPTAGSSLENFDLQQVSPAVGLIPCPLQATVRTAEQGARARSISCCMLSSP